MSAFRFEHGRCPRNRCTRGGIGSGAEPPSEHTRAVAHPLAGQTSAEESARLIRNYRYAVERMMRILGGWIALTPEISAKLLLGRHVWDNAQHADALGKRLPELRAPAHASEPANAAFAAFMDAIEEPERPSQTVERLVGVYRVLKPHLLATYEDHLHRVNAVYEPPTQRILQRAIDDERRHIAAGLTVIQHVASAPEHEQRAAAWRARLDGLLEASGGVTGQGLPPAARLDGGAVDTALSDDAHELIRLELSATRWPIPDDLRAAVRAFGDALVAGDAAAARRWSGAEAGGWDDVLQSAVSQLEARSHRPVAFAKIGGQRVIKLRVDGRGGAATLITRWIPSAEGWRVAAIEVTAVEISRPT